jgi:hypothetical protein
VISEESALLYIKIALDGIKLKRAQAEHYSSGFFFLSLKLTFNFSLFGGRIKRVLEKGVHISSNALKHDHRSISESQLPL